MDSKIFITSNSRPLISWLEGGGRKTWSRMELEAYGSNNDMYGTLYGDAYVDNGQGAM